MRYLLRRQWLPISVIPRIKVLNTKTLYLELNCTLTGSFALIGNHPCLRGRYARKMHAYEIHACDMHSTHL
jgi:hypothetical protein